MNSNEPVAWRVCADDGSETVHLFYEQARAAADEWNWRVEPLYRQPQPTLTDEEREAITEAVGAYNFNDDDKQCANISATLSGLLERTSAK